MLNPILTLPGAGNHNKTLHFTKCKNKKVDKQKTLTNSGQT